MVESKSVPYLLDLGPSMSGVVSPGRMTHSRLIGAGLIDNRRCFLNLLDYFAGQAKLTITGQLTNGTFFEGTDVIRVIDKAGKK